MRERMQREVEPMLKLFTSKVERCVACSHGSPGPQGDVHPW